MNQNLEQLRREVITDSLLTDQFAEGLERRLAALEEITAARWPRRILVRRRLARDLRASVAGYREIDDFGSRRIQAISDGWIEPLSAHRGTPSQTSLRSA